MATERLRIKQHTQIGDWEWEATDVQGRVVGRSHKGFSSKRACEHNARVVNNGLTMGLDWLNRQRGK